MITQTLSSMSGRTGPLAALEQEIVQARRALRDLWRCAPTADRIFAIDRLLRADVLSPELEASLQSLQDLVRDRWVTARVAATLQGIHADAHIAGLQLMMAEQHRDMFLEAQGLFDPLFVTAEGFLRSVPLIGARSFKELLREREIMRARLVPILPPVEDQLGNG